MNIYELLETDQVAEEKGIWIDISDGVRIKIASTESKRYREKVTQLLKPYRKILQAGGRVPDAKQEQITVDSIVDGLLLDWEGVSDREGAILEYNRENARKVVGELKRLRDIVLEVASEAEVFNKRVIEEAAKNLKKPSAGNSPGATKKPSSSSKQD